MDDRLLTFRPSRDTPEGHAIFVGIWMSVMKNQVKEQNFTAGYERYSIVNDETKFFIQDSKSLSTAD